MKSFEHCEHEHERAVFQQLSDLFPDAEGIELYPNFELFDESKKSYLECDLVVISKNHCAVVELKHWRGEIDIAHNFWYRNGRAVSDPHLSNNRKCKVLKSTIERIIPASRKVPFVNSIVVLTNPDGNVSGADAVSSLFKHELMPAQLTFDGISVLVSYLKKRRHGTDHSVLSGSEFSQVKAFFDRVSDLPKEEYTDQIPGYKIVKDLDHTDNYASYLATENPPLGDAHYRLRVFGILSNDPIKQARQTRSLTELRRLGRHENILHAFRHPNGKNLVVEVSEWLGLETLEQRLANVGQMVWMHASKIALGVAKALSYIHSSDQMLVHRNVSPKSILLNSENVPQLTDFDLVYDPTAEHTVFVDPSKACQPYLAPEVRVGGADPKSDVYSWGATFFAMLAGEPPKTRDKGVLKEGLTDQLLERLPPDVPSALISLLIDVMQYKVEERPEANEVVERLSGILQPEEEAVQPLMTSNTWVLKELLAEGATSKVYLGDCLGESAALKLYSHEVSKDLCVHERSMLSAAAGPCVPKYKFFMQWDDGRWCLAMEHVSGRKLRDLIKSHTLPSLEAFRDVANQLLDTLISMHPLASSDERVGIIHNDINPNNIFYDEQEGRAYLIDFGAASWPGPVTYRGTQGYVHPGLVSAGELEALPLGDIYSLGVTLWEWIVGERPEKDSKYGDIALEGCSVLQKKKLFGWLAKCWGRERESYEFAGEALEDFQAIWEEEALLVDVSAEKVIVPEAEVFGDEEKCSAAPFVDYLNSIHNVTASNAHALAEAQAVNPYFVDIYEPFSLVDKICDYLSGTDPVVIVLTGHAGDGKSTIALDGLKKLKRLPEGKVLDAPPREIESVKLKEGRYVKIVKDMSELSADARVNILKESLENEGSESVSWLIVSNTGPLLSSFSELKKGKAQLKIESDILRLLNQPIESTISSEEHCLDGFSKPVLLVNMAKLNNVEIATRVLKRVVSHPCWATCVECEAKDSCHIALNVKALQEVGD
ncbi:MAG: NERD domain-containing protein kinase family protein, partial [Desulforhabdus sp.]|nr:NERD domain-containing protein kinase family protein [Desulforhabdus sp.]